MNDFPASGFIFTLPLYSYLIEPGPRPGFLRDPKTQIVFVPLWTDSDTFETYLQRSGLAGKVSGLRIYSREELIACLRSIPSDQIKHIMVDPSARAPDSEATKQTDGLGSVEEYQAGNRGSSAIEHGYDPSWIAPARLAQAFACIDSPPMARCKAA